MQFTLQCTLDEAHAALRAGRDAEALDLARWGLERYPGDPFLLDVEARALSGLRLPANPVGPLQLASAEEIEAWRQAELVRARLTEAESLRRMGRAEEARAVVDELLEEHPETTRGWELLGWLRLDAGDGRGALSAFERFVAQSEADGDPVPVGHPVREGMRAAADLR